MQAGQAYDGVNYGMEPLAVYVYLDETNPIAGLPAATPVLEDGSQLHSLALVRRNTRCPAGAQPNRSAAR